MRVTGVDACRGGWVAVELTRGALTGMRTEATLAALLAGVDWVTGIDMPLGLLESEWRAVDRLAAERLGPRRSSVFPIPPRPVWVQLSHAEANKLCRELTGRGLSVQTWGLRTRLLEADEYREKCPHPFYEVHPELAFAAMAGTPLTEPARLPELAPLSDSKHTPAGLERRRELLARADITVPGRDVASTRTSARSRPIAPLADTLDAAAVAWSAHRIATDTAAIVSAPETDDRGREIAIRY
jgi:predicted RNase H-like nuclease